MKLILAINPGSTSTKIAVFEGDQEVFTKTLRHPIEEISQYTSVIDQYQFRLNTILKSLEENHIDKANLVAIVGRGGLLRPISSGTYEVNEEMIKDLSSAEYGEHASNLGGVLANAISSDIPSCRAFIADPVVVDELQDVARISGHPLFPNLSIFHALNQKAIAKQYAREQGVKYENLKLIVAHLGGGTSVGVHKGGKVIDVNNALEGAGAFSPERSGSLPALPLAKACFSGKFSFNEIKKMISGKGGLVAHLNTNSFIEVENRMKEGDEKAILIANAYVYNVAKQIGASAAVLSGNCDAILITGGIAYGKELMQQLSDMVSFIAPVKVYPGENEMGALANNGLAVLEGREEVKVY
ncbi:MAG: butyrate kinase [Bacteroidales bacterium]